MIPLETRLRLRIDTLTDERDDLRERLARSYRRTGEAKAARNRWRQRAKDAEWGQHQALRGQLRGGDLRDPGRTSSLRPAELHPLATKEPISTTSPRGSADLNDRTENDEPTRLTVGAGTDGLEEEAA